MVKYNPIAFKPVDYSTPLKDVYAKQSESLDRFHAQLRERDRQEEANTVDLPEIVSKLAAFSNSIRSAHQKHKEGKKEKRIKLRMETERARIEAGANPEQTKKHISHINTNEELKSSYNDAEIYLKNQYEEEKIDLKTMNYILSQHGGKYAGELDLISYNSVKHLELNMSAAANQKGEEGDKWKGSALQTRIDATANDPKAREHLMKEFAYSQFADIGVLDSDYINETYWPLIEKKLNTKGTLDKVKYEKTINSQLAITQDAELEVAIAKRDTEPDGIAKTIQRQINAGVSKKDGITIEKSKDNYALRLYRLAKNEKLTQDDLNLLKKGAIKHPAGKEGDVLLTDKHWQTIQKGINEASTAAVTKKTAGLVTAAKGVEAEIIAGNGTKEELQRKKDEALLQLSMSVGKDHKAYKDLESWDVEEQIKGSYEKTRAEYAGYYDGTDVGLLLQNEDSFKLIKNGRVRNELAGKVEEAKAVLREAGLPTTWKEYLRATKDTMITSPAMVKTITRETAFSDNQKAVQNLIANQQLKTLLTASKNGESLETAKKVHKQWLEDNGYSVVDEKNPKGQVGILSPTITGDYKHFKFVNEAKVENNTAPSLGNLNTWNGKVQTGVIKYGTVNAALKEPESFLDKEDTLGAFIEKTNDKGKIEVFYSPEVLTKAMMLGKQPSEVLRESLKALINGGPEYKEYVKRFDLKGKLELLDNAPDLKFKQMIEQTGDKDLINQYNRAGGFTPKQMTRMLTLKVTGLNTAFANKEKKADLVKRSNAKREKDNRIEQNTQARNTVNQIGQGIQEYFEGTDERSEEEINDQFNSQPGIF